jgi:hypothetical protein
MLMPCLHAQIAIEKVDTEWAEQDAMDDMWWEVERVQCEERAVKEAELDEREA